MTSLDILSPVGRIILDGIEIPVAGGSSAAGGYNITSVLLEDGTQKYVITTAVDTEKPKDMLQARVDATNSCRFLFYYYWGTELDISRLDTSNVTSMESMFHHCSKLTSLDLSNLNTSNVKTMYNMFCGCTSLTSINVSGFDTSQVTNMREMFNSCSGNLTTLDLSSFNTSNVTDMTKMFAYCNLKTILGEIDMIKVTSTSGIFQNCTNLIDVTFKNIKVSLQLGSGTSYNPNLSDNTIINTFKELHDLTGETTQTLTLSTPSNERTDAIYVKLIEATDEMIANDPYITSKKPCVVCESTDEGAMTLKEYGISKNWNIA